MEHHSGHVVTLANSIIGVSILAMPYCFKQCGILLALLMLVLSNLITRLCCHFLIKSAIISRRKTFEYLAYYVCGAFGKFAIEMGLIGFLIGTCIAFFVVMGDLGPEFISELTGRHTSNTMRTSILMALALFCVLPLGLLRNVQSLSGVSKATIGFYFCLVLKIVVEAFPYFFAGDWTSKVEMWRPSGVIQCLPIFSMALSCQTQLFEIYQVIYNPTLEKLNNVVKNAVNICTIVYFCVGFFGYIAFAHRNFTGNILLSFVPCVLTTVIKLGFVLSVAFSFPLVIFPCRASVHSLLYREGFHLHEGANNYIPEGRFKGITLSIIFLSLIVGILIPNIELVLGLVGSTIGIVVCILFPALCFIHVFQKDTNERLLAKFVFVIGFSLMILGTYENLNRLEKIESSPIVENIVTEKKELFKIMDPPLKDLVKENLPNEISVDDIKKMENDSQKVEHKKVTQSPEIRHEPPEPLEPQEPLEELQKPKVDIKLEVLKLESVLEPSKNTIERQDNEPQKVVLPDKIDSAIVSEGLGLKLKNRTKPDEAISGGIKRNEIDTTSKPKIEEKAGNIDPHLEEHKILLDKIQKQNEVQEEIVKQQKKLIEVIEEQQKQKVNEEKLKAVKEIESIALKAIEQISSDVKQNEKIVANLEKDVKQKVISKEDKSEKPLEKTSDGELKKLKSENILLNNKIQLNMESIKKPNLTVIVNNDIKDSALSNGVKKVNQSVTNNNTAPLLLNLGPKNVDDEGKISAQNMIPLPIIAQKAQNARTINGSKVSEGIKSNVLDSEASMMRRDILSYITTKRR